MKILRIGSFHGAPYRYLNLFKDNPSDNFTWIHIKDDSSIKSLKLLLNQHDINNVSFLVIPGIIYVELFQKIALKLNESISKIIFPLYSTLFKLFSFATILPKEITKIFKQSDLIWIGNNDLDYCLALTCYFKFKFPKSSICLSYQEHRSTFRLDEKLALKLADKLIIPTYRSVKILNEIYDINFEPKVSIANEDWRSKAYQYTGIKVKNTVPKILIISNFAEYGSISARRGSRVNYLRVLELFLKLNIEVHLYVNKICYSFGYPEEDKDTPYHKLENKYNNFKLNHGPLSLNSIKDYEKFYEFDYGFLHNYIKGESVNRFNSINIPNRIFEYLNMGIKPIILKDTLIEAEDLLKSVNVYFAIDDYNKLYEKHIEEPKTFDFKTNKLTFEEFFKVLLKNNS